MYVTSNDIPWKVRLYKALRSFGKKGLQAKLRMISGYSQYQNNCVRCHGVNLVGGSFSPNISKVYESHSREEMRDIIVNGYKSMPGLEVDNDSIVKIIDYVYKAGEIITKNVTKNEYPWSYSYTSKYFKRFQDYEGYPASKPPWGSLTAINLNNGKIIWTTPLGEYEELTKRGVGITGTENYGGATATSGDVVFSAGTLDGKVRAFSSKNGKELWSYKLPYASFTPPTIYEIKGKQYILVVSSGGGVAFKNNPKRARHGDIITVFGLPD